MAQFDINFEIPKKCIKKLNTVYNLDTITNDEYELIILSDVSTLIKDNLDKATDSNIISKEATGYERPLVPMTLTELVAGYQIGTNIINIDIDDGSSVHINGFLIVKRNTQDILASCLSMNSITLDDSFNITPESSLWVIGERVCTN